MANYMTDQEMVEMFREADINGDGQISSKSGIGTFINNVTQEVGRGVRQSV